MADQITLYLADCDPKSSPFVVASEIELYANFLDSLETDQYESSSFRNRTANKIVEIIESLLADGRSAKFFFELHSWSSPFDGERESLENELLSKVLVQSPTAGLTVWRGLDQISSLLRDLTKFATHPDFEEYKSGLEKAIKLVAAALSASTPSDEVVLVGLLKCDEC